MKMGDEQYKLAVSDMKFYGGLLQEVVKECGWEKALEMQGRHCFKEGISWGQELKKAAGDKKFDVKLLEATNTEMMTAFGNTFKVSETANSVKYEISRCPQYDGLKAAGFSHEQIRKMCVTMSSKQYEGFKSVLPNIIVSTKPRIKPDGICIEEYGIS
jgi:hypothetical protein